MKKLLSVILAAVLVLSLASSLSVFGAELAPSWTLLERNEGNNGSLKIDENGAFLLSSGNWGGYGVGSKKMYPLDENNPITIGANITLGTVCPTGEGAERHRYFSVILTAEALTYTKTYGASSLPGAESYIELRIFDTNDVDGVKMAMINIEGAFSAYDYSGKSGVAVKIPDFNSKTDANAEISIKVKGDDIEFHFNGKLLLSVNGVAKALNGKAFLGFGVSSYGAAEITDSAVKTINGVPANSSAGTLESDYSKPAVLNEEKWTVCAPLSQIGALYTMPDGSFLLNSAGFGGIGVFSKESIRIKNMEMTLDISVPVGNIPTGGPDRIRGFSVVFAVNPVTQMEINGATAIPTDEGFLAIRITDDEAMDGKKNLYILPYGTISDVVFGDVYGPVDEAIPLEGVDGSSIKLTIRVKNRDLYLSVNGKEVAVVEGIMKGFFGKATIGFTATSYGSALCKGAHVKMINNEVPNDFDLSKTVISENKSTGGCGNNG